jgi:signal transduction histidine kinase
MATAPPADLASAFDLEIRPANEPYLTSTVPPHPTPVPEIVAALRNLPPLDGLTEAEFEWIAKHSSERMGGDGAMVFREGEPSHHMVFILRGEIHVRRRNSGPMAYFTARAGQITGKLPFSRMKGFGGDGHTAGQSWVLDIHESLFPELLIAIPSMGQRCVGILLDRVREVTRMEQQAEKLSALGKLAANLAHELNNPASAAQRSAASLFGQLGEYGEAKYRLGNLYLSEQEQNDYRGWIKSARDRMSAYSSRSHAPQSPLAINDREDAITQWLEAHNVPKPWTIAPSLAETHLPIDQLDELAAILRPDIVAAAVSAVASALRVERMAETVVDSTVRIFDLITAIKDYSYMDQAPMQDIDLAQSLENTLSMFSSRLQGVTVEREYDPALLPISAYGSELSQVWTALIENAIDAMDLGSSPGVLKLTAHVVSDMASIEVWDNGPGVDPAIKSRLFEPFFTTKAVGSGLGLGLDTAQRIVSRHSGFITVESKPGATCFQVRLPFDQAQAY